MHRTDGGKRSWLARLIREPTLHFFAIAAFLLLGQRLIAGDPRTVVITPALKADLLRRYHDQLNRAPTPAEAAAFLEGWKQEEALYREALREGIDRDDPTVRNVLVSEMRSRAALQTRIPEPTESDLHQYLEQHRDQFEAPLIYEHEYAVFSKSESNAEEERATYEQQLNDGATPAALELRSTAANVDRKRIEREFGPKVADAICQIAPGKWHELETENRLLLVRMIRIHGGLPTPKVLRARLIASWKAEEEHKSAERAARKIADRYHFEEPR